MLLALDFVWFGLSRMRTELCPVVVSYSLDYKQVELTMNGVSGEPQWGKGEEKGLSCARLATLHLPSTSSAPCPPPGFPLATLVLAIRTQRSPGTVHWLPWWHCFCQHTVSLLVRTTSTS